MDRMTCTANSYGNIDYGKPVAPHLNDYRTTTGFCHRRLSEFTSSYYSVKPRIAVNSLIKDNRLLLECYKSMYNEHYGNKYKSSDTRERPALSNKIHHMRDIQEKNYKNPPRPVKYPISEYHSEYLAKDRIVDREIIPPPTLCPLKSIGGDDQDRIHIETPVGLLKRMDPYVTSTRLAHIPFTADQIRYSSAASIPTFYTAKNEPSSPAPKQPVFDKRVFKEGVKDRIRRPIVCRVPHLGCKTEYSSKYKPPTSSDVYTEIHYNGVLYPEVIKKPNQIQTMSAPGMYCTEGCHTGTGWPVTAVVNRQKDDKLHVHKHEIPCYTEIV